jgi:ribonuclease R
VVAALEDAGRPLRLDPLAAALGLVGRRALLDLQRTLDELIRTGHVLCNRRGAYLLMERTSLARGTVQGHPDGYGFVVRDEGGDDVHLAPREMKKLFHGDRVAVRITRRDSRGRVSGEVAEVLERGVSELVGRFRMVSGVSFLVPSDPRQSREVDIAPGARAGARDGQIVVAEITHEPGVSSRALARVTEILGEATDPQMEIEIAVRAFSIPHRWPADVLAEAEALGERVKPRDKRGRVDLRDLPLVTIDGADARDFDDAVYAARTRDGWRLVVAIADVSHYVREGSPLNREGYERATSVYFPRRVVPMLPEELSNGLCSLKPRVDRLALVCDMRFGNTGKVTRTRFVKAIIRSHARLTYESVQALLDGDASERARHKALVPHLEELQALYHKLAVARRRRGALELDQPEPQFRFDEDDSVAGIDAYRRTDAHRIIEECMIAANVEAARYIEPKHVPALYRVHDNPDPEKVKELRAAARSFGFELGGDDDPGPRDFAKLLSEVRDRPEAPVLTVLTLRSLARAVYGAECNGHFGLGLKRYAHFTSPIRRYPDLLVHRAITYILGGGTPSGYLYSEETMEAMGQHCSLNERRANEASWDVEAWLKCSYMRERVGETFDGHIVGVADFGLFVQIDDALVDGLVHVAQLDADYYTFDNRSHTLVGSSSGRRFRLGDRVRVRCAAVRIDERKIDLALEEHEGRAVESAGAGRGKPGGGRGHDRKRKAPAKGDRKSGKRGKPGKSGKSGKRGGR